MYDPLAYWTEAGKTYAQDFAAGRIGHGYALQEARLMALLERLEFATVLEVGCGFGRITRLVADRFPGVQITGIDLSADQFERARALVPEARFRRTTIQALPAPAGRRYDLVLAVEVLMHVPPPDVAAAVGKLRRLAARHIVTVDWTEAIAKPIAAWNFRHDYAALLGPGSLVETVGLQGIHHLEVER